MLSHDNCNAEFVKINGRTLRQGLEITKANHRFGSISPTVWVNVCPKCDAYALGGELTHPLPFLCKDSVMRTVSDFNSEINRFDSTDLDFHNFRFSISALESAIAMVLLEDAATAEVEMIGFRINGQSSSADLLKFSEQVCEWGRGQRVWANLQRFNNDMGLAKALDEWFRIASSSSDDETAIQPGTMIKGLGVSFASKHLRMLDPSRFAVLDEVLSEGLGFALNPKGYKLFMRLLRDFSDRNRIQQNISKLEAGLFTLVRQHVRAKIIA